MDFVAAEVARSRRSEDALHEAMAAQQASKEQQMRGMQAEKAPQITWLVAEAVGAAKRSELAEKALIDLRDSHVKHRIALREAAEYMVRPAPVQVDRGVANYSTTSVSAVDERSVHNSIILPCKWSTMVRHNLERPWLGTTGARSK
jgi:hypothetical protein